MQYSRIAKNAKLGDGCIARSCRNANLTFVSTDIELLNLKREMCLNEGLIIGDIGTQKSGYGGKKIIYKFGSRVDERITDVYHASLTDLIKTLDKEDVFLWYMDDGSWHKNQHLHHLYCNMLNDEELEVLIEQIYNLFGVRPKARKDRKQDGREFNYLYFPRNLTIQFRPQFKEYVMSKGLMSMYYKFGGLEYTDFLETLDFVIPDNVFSAVANSFSGAKRAKGTDISIEDEGSQILVKYTNRKGEVKQRNILKEAV